MLTCDIFSETKMTSAYDQYLETLFPVEKLKVIMFSIVLLFLLKENSKMKNEKSHEKSQSLCVAL